MKIDSSPQSCFLRLKRWAALLIAFLLLVGLTVPSISYARKSYGRVQERQKARRALIISIDGLDARYLNRADEYGLKIPNLRRLMNEGTRARGVVSVFPSVTYPAHTTLVTGVSPARHGIYGNEQIDAPQGAVNREWYWYTKDIRADTIWEAARRGGLKVGMVSWPVGVGAGDYNVPEIIRFGGTLSDTLARIKENARPEGLVTEIEKSDPRLYANANKDEQDDMRTRFAEYIMREKRPDVMLVHLFDLDHFEHEKGPFTPEAFSILEKSDAYVGRMLEAARQAGTLDETAVFIVSDHGFMPISKLVQPGVLLERAGLLKLGQAKNAKGETVSVVTDWRAIPFVTNGSCAIILHDKNDKEALRRVRAIFEPLAGRKGSGIREVLEGQRLRAIGANPRAALMLDAEDGFAFGSNYTGEVITESKQRGAHGFLPTRPNYYASFIASGAGITRRSNLGIVLMVMIGQTIARSINLTLRDAPREVLDLWPPKMSLRRVRAQR